ncbi:MAG: phosphodiester glycosidase family protein [Bacteroidota bacterium]
MAEGEEQHRIDVRTEGYGNFFLQPNGVFAVDTTGQAVVMTTQDFAANNHQVWESATQSGPMMVIDGQINSLFNDGSPNLHIRNAVGITPEGRVIFAKSQQTVTFFELSSLMIQQGCSQALYLDGFVSQTYLPELGIGSLEAGTSLGPLIAVFDKSPAI